jgi:hypothetical protein
MIRRSPESVIPNEESRRFFFCFAPAKQSALAVYLPWQAEESLFDLSRKPRQFFI